MTERLRLCCELKEESCGGIHFYEMLKLKQLPKVTIITGTGLSGPLSSGGRYQCNDSPEILPSRTVFGYENLNFLC